MANKINETVFANNNEFNSNEQHQPLLQQTKTLQISLPTAQLQTINTSASTSGTTAAPYIIQNGNIYQLTSNNQLISRSSIQINQISSDNNNSDSMQLANSSDLAQNKLPISTINLNNIRQLNMLNPKITPLITNNGVTNPTNPNSNLKLTTIKSGTVLNLNTANRKSNYIQTSSQKINIPTSSNLTKQILIANPSQTAQGVGTTSNQPSIIVLAPVNSNLNDSAQVVDGKNININIKPASPNTTQINQQTVPKIHSLASNCNVIKTPQQQTVQYYLSNSNQANNNSLNMIADHHDANKITLTPVNTQHLINQTQLVNNQANNNNILYALNSTANVQQMQQVVDKPKSAKAAKTAKVKSQVITKVSKVSQPTAPQLDVQLKNEPHENENKFQGDVDFLLNEYLLPDTRIFTSFANKDFNNNKLRENAAKTNSGGKGVLTDLNYKTVLIGNSEHVVLDNLNNLSDFRGNFDKLKNIAFLLANKLNKPVSIPAFLLIENKDSLDRVKQTLNDKNINPIVIDTNAQTNQAAQIQIMKYEPVSNSAEQSSNQSQEMLVNSAKQVKRKATKVKTLPTDQINEQILLNNQNIIQNTVVNPQIQQVQYVQANNVPISNEPSNKKTRIDLVNEYLNKNSDNNISNMNQETVQIQQNSAPTTISQNEYIQVVNTQQQIDNNALLGFDASKDNEQQQQQQQTYFIQTNTNASNVNCDVNNMNVANNEQFKNILNNLKANLNLNTIDGEKASEENTVVSNASNGIKQNTTQSDYDMNCYPVDSSSLFNINLNDIEWIA